MILDEGCLFKCELDAFSSESQAVVVSVDLLFLDMKFAEDTSQKLKAINNFQISVSRLLQFQHSYIPIDFDALTMCVLHSVVQATLVDFRMLRDPFPKYLQTLTKECKRVPL